MTVRAPKRRDQVAVVSAQLVFGRLLLRKRARFAVIAFVQLTQRRQQPPTSFAIVPCEATDRRKQNLVKMATLPVRITVVSGCRRN